MRMLQRRPYFTRALSPVCRGVSVLCGQTNSVHPTPVAYRPKPEGGTLSFSFGPGISAWIARSGNQINGKEARMATSASEVIQATATQWGVK